MSADEMFKELGYVLVCNSKYIIYQKNVDFSDGSEILSITIGGGLSRIKKERLLIGLAMTKSLPEFITLNELQAINKKVEELGWIKE